MNHIEFYANGHRMQENNRGQAVYFVCLLAGIYGILQYVQDLPDIFYTGWIVCLHTVLLCGMLWSIYFYLRRIFALCLAVICMAGACVGFVLRHTLKMQIRHICNSIFGTTDGVPVSVTETVLMLALVLSVLFFVMEILLKNHRILFLLTLALLLLSPAVGIQSEIKNVIPLAFFQVMFLTARASDRSRRSCMQGSGEIRSEKKTAVYMAAFLGAAFLAAVPFVSHYEQMLYGIVDWTEGTAYRLKQQISGRADAPESSGIVSSGNNYRTGTAQLELKVSRQPSENLYLKGFEGGVYTGGRWERADDKMLFADMQKILNWERWGTMIGSMYSSMYFAVNNMMPEKGRKEPAMLTIRHVNGEYRNSYIPYYSQNRRVQDDDNEASDGYDYLYHEQKDMKIDWDHVAYRYSRVRDWYRQVRDAYMEEIRTAYTQVPDYLLPRLSALAAENPQEDLEEITAFILQTLQRRVSYTLTPGRAPVSEDIVEYFLFERGAGYCVHYASAATLLYRLYCVPARYVSGYLVTPSDFVQQEDGTYLAMVTDASAHAWTEIFLEDYGWTPVEATPAADGSFTASYPGFDSFLLLQAADKQGLEGGAEDRQISGSKPDSKTAKEQEMSDERDRITDILHNNENTGWFFAAILIYTLLLLPVSVDYHRLQQLKRLESADCQKVYAGLIQMLHFAGLLSEFDGSEEEFAAELAAAIPAVSDRDIRHMQDIISEAAFSLRVPGPEKEEFVKILYFQLAEQVYRTLNRTRKWIFRYWKVFG